jgi:hypothetical protein
MRTTFTRYIIVIKEPGRQGDKTYSALRAYLPNTTIALDAQQLAIFVVPDSYYIQSVQPGRTMLNKTEIYSAPLGWEVFSLADQSEYEVELNTTSDFGTLKTPQANPYRIISDGEMEIYGNFTGGWIVVKDHYFPTWHAYMDGKELELRESNLGTLLIKTGLGNTIYLAHRHPWYEQVLSIVAILGILGMFALLHRMPEKERTE